MGYGEIDFETSLMDLLIFELLSVEYTGENVFVPAREDTKNTVHSVISILSIFGACYTVGPYYRGTGYVKVVSQLSYSPS